MRTDGEGDAQCRNRPSPGAALTHEQKRAEKRNCPEQTDRRHPCFAGEIDRPWTGCVSQRADEPGYPAERLRHDPRQRSNRDNVQRRAKPGHPEDIPRQQCRQRHHIQRQRWMGGDAAAVGRQRQPLAISDDKRKMNTCGLIITVVDERQRGQPGCRRKGDDRIERPWNRAETGNDCRKHCRDRSMRSRKHNDADRRGLHHLPVGRTRPARRPCARLAGASIARHTGQPRPPRPSRRRWRIPPCGPPDPVTAISSVTRWASAGSSDESRYCAPSNGLTRRIDGTLASASIGQPPALRPRPFPGEFGRAKRTASPTRAVHVSGRVGAVPAANHSRAGPHSSASAACLKGRRPPLGSCRPDGQTSPAAGSHGRPA